MKKLIWVAALAALFVAVLAGYWLGLHHAAEPAAGESAKEDADNPLKKSIAQVEVAPVRLGNISEEITVYGSVTAQPDKVQTVSLPFECNVTRLLVSPGETVSKGTQLVEIEPSAETQLLYEEAKNAAAAAAQDLQQTQQRFDAKLAANQELGMSKQAAKTAENKLRNLEKRGIGKRKTLVSEADGLVGEIKAQAGQIVAAGSPLMDVVAANQIEARLGVEPDLVERLKVGQMVRLFSVNDAGAPVAEGRIRLITHRVNPEVRLVDVFVSLPADARLLLNEYVRAKITVASAANAVLVPRSALLPGEDSWSLFVVKDKHSVRKLVRKGMETNRETEIIGSDLKEGDPVVVVGNYELEDGMTVETQ